MNDARNPNQPSAALGRRGLVATSAVLLASAGLPGANAQTQPQKKSSSEEYLITPNRFVESDGRRIAYRSIGSGKPIVLLTRFRATMDDWDPAFIDALAAQGMRVITFDYSGLGLSTGKPTYHPNSLGKDANDLISALDLKDVTVCGWSMGGMARKSSWRHTLPGSATAC